MAELAHDPNKQDSPQTSTNILAPQSSPAQTQGNEETIPNVSNSGANYVSNGNPYGNYGSPQSQQQTQNTKPQSVKKSSSSTTPSSGMHTNVQSYMDKNQAGSQRLGQAVSGKLQSSADLARQNLAGTEKSFQQGMDAGSIENWQGAVDEARGAYQQAAGQKAAERRFVDNSASMYRPEPTQAQGQESPAYSEQDQALIDSNMARVMFGDGTSRDFRTEDEAQQAIDDWNRQNPGYYTYGDEEQLSVSDDRLRDILNAQYAGPSDLHQAAGYSDVYNQFNKAQDLQDLAQSTGFKGTLLRETFENPNMTYSLGNQLLDDLLLGRGQAADTLRETAQNLGDAPSGNISDEFNRRILDARNLASQRASDIEGVRTGAREALDEVALGRQSEIENRLSGIIEDWEKYPQHYRDILTQEVQRHGSLKQNYDKYKDLSQRVESIPNIQNEISQLESSIPALEKALVEARNRNYPIGDRRGSINHALAVTQASNNLANAKNRIQSLNSQIAETQRLEQELGEQGFSPEDFVNFNPNNMNLGLSQLEAEMLGIRGGEGLYNILSQEGGIDNLIKTAQADRNKLVSRDEQSQLARLQNIAQLAEDYGSANSGIDFRNQYDNRDLAGTQSALDALDMDNLRNVLQGAERDFRDYAEAANIRGTGTGKGSSGGALGKKTKKVTKSLDTNLGDLIDDAEGWRNIYGDQGVNQENINSILGLSDQVAGLYDSYTDRAMNTGIPQIDIPGIGPELLQFNPASLTDPGANISQVGDRMQQIGGMYKDLVGDTLVGDILGLTTGGIVGNNLGAIGSLVSNLGEGTSSALFGNSGKAKSKATKKAYAAAEKNLKSNINKALQDQGYGNQLGVRQDTQRDLDLLQLLGMLDKTNV